MIYVADAILNVISFLTILLITPTRARTFAHVSLKGMR